MALTVGQKLGPYEILAAIGAGGMGEVYRARDERLKRDVAIKVLPAAYSADPERLRRFEQEAQAAGALNHPNITAVYDFGSNTIDGAPYIVTELLEGETLRSRLAGGPFTPRRAIGHALQLAQGLAAAHDKGIVHRDLKPENVFVTNDGRVKILDFGLAKLTQPEGVAASQTNLPTASPETEPGRVMGTVGYMSPEQVRGKFVDARSDIFAFGAILYEMLSGKRAFQGDTAADTMSAILTKDPPDLSETDRRVPDALDRIVRHCLEKSPRARFQSASDVAFNLEALSGAPLTSGVQPEIPARRRRYLLPITAAAFLVLSIAEGWTLLSRRNVETSSHPTFRRLTFRRGFTNNAAFAPDGETIVYSAAWDGKPMELFSTRVGAAESRSLGLPQTDILSISATGEMLILRHHLTGADTLARAPLAGGSARDILDGVRDADWSPDGNELAIIRRGTVADTLESPIGKVLHRGPVLGSVRFGRRGDRIAVAEWSEKVDGGSISVVDLFGKVRVLTDGWGALGWLRWSSDGSEIWFRGGKVNVGVGIYGVSLDGKVRSVFATPTALTIYDIAKNGRAVLSQHIWRSDIFWSRPGFAREQEASWLDWSLPIDLSDDGKTLLFHEQREGGGPNGSVYLRRDPAEPPVRLAEGYAYGLSPDGKWALIHAPASGARPARLMLVPTGAGEPKPLGTAPVERLNDGTWMPDGKHVLFRGTETGKGARIYVLDIEQGPPRPVTPEGKADGYMPASPDSLRIAVSDDEKIWIYPIGDGDPRALPGDWANSTPIRWSADGHFLFVWTGTRAPGQIWRVNVESGAKMHWTEIAPSDVAGLERLNNVNVSPDGKSYVYSLERRWSDLYVAEGLK